MREFSADDPHAARIQLLVPPVLATQGAQGYQGHRCIAVRKAYAVIHRANHRAIAGLLHFVIDAPELIASPVCCILRPLNTAMRILKPMCKRIISTTLSAVDRQEIKMQAIDVVANVCS